MTTDLPKSLTATFTVAAALLLAALFTSGCGGDSEDSAGPGPEEPAPLLTVEEALSGEEGTFVRVRGTLFVDEAGVRLCSAVLESYPPQCGGATLELEELDLDRIVALERPQALEPGGSPGELPRWTNYELVVGGTLKEETLRVTEQPPVAESRSEGLVLRFAYSPVPLQPGPVSWALDVQNTGGEARELTFASGQRIEISLTPSAGGDPVYRWSEGKMFTQAIETVTIEAGQTWTVTRSDTLPSLEPGSYTVEAALAADVDLPPARLEAQTLNDGGSR
ncbi:MAG: hypothetical protein Kow00129_12630 [Thermoleophilia bacterium]